MVSVRVAKPQHQAPRGLEPQRVDEFFAQQPHGSGAQDDDALLVQADDALIRPEIEDLSDMEVSEIDLLRQRREGFHGSRLLHSSGPR